MPPALSAQGFRGSARYWRLLVVDAYSATGRVTIHEADLFFEAQGELINKHGVPFVVLVFERPSHMLFGCADGCVRRRCGIDGFPD